MLVGILKRNFNEMKKYILIVSLFFVSLLSLDAQTSWTKDYVDQNFYVKCIEFNSSYFCNNLSSRTLIKTDLNGDTIFQKNLNFTGNLSAFYPADMVKTFDNKLLLAGHVNPNSSNEKLHVVLIDSNAQVLKIDSFLNTSPNGNRAKIINTIDSGYAVISENALQGYLIKIDKYRNFVFRQNFGYNLMYPSDLIQLQNGDFYGCGYRTLPSHKSFIFCTDSLGALKWTVDNQSTSISYFRSLVKFKDKLYITGGNQTNQAIVFKYDTTGQANGSLSFNYPGVLGELKVSGDSNLLALALLLNDTVSVIRFDTLGNVNFKHNTTVTSNGQSGNFFIDKNGDYLYCGSRNSQTFLTKIINGYPLSVNEILRNNLVIYPNPITSNYFNLNSSEQFDDFKIFNYSGQIIQKGKLFNQIGHIKPISVGNYLIKLSNKNKIIYSKIEIR
jgi:hypothetical protein